LQKDGPINRGKGKKGGFVAWNEKKQANFGGKVVLIVDVYGEGREKSAGLLSKKKAARNP